MTLMGLEILDVGFRHLIVYPVPFEPISANCYFITTCCYGFCINIFRHFYALWCRVEIDDAVVYIEYFASWLSLLLLIIIFVGRLNVALLTCPGSKQSLICFDTIPDMNFSYCALFNSNYLSAALCFNVTFIDNNLNPNITFTLLLLRLS